MLCSVRVNLLLILFYLHNSSNDKKMFLFSDGSDNPSIRKLSFFVFFLLFLYPFIYFHHFNK